jgi:hypothetical protein
MHSKLQGHEIRIEPGISNSVTHAPVLQPLDLKLLWAVFLTLQLKQEPLSMLTRVHWWQATENKFTLTLTVKGTYCQGGMTWSSLTLWLKDVLKNWYFSTLLCGSLHPNAGFSHGDKQAASRPASHPNSNLSKMRWCVALIDPSNKQESIFPKSIHKTSLHNSLVKIKSHDHS